MSLVLEALKKQEAGSDPDAAVSLARQAGQRRRHRLWMGLFAAAMVVNVVVLFWAFGLPLLRDGTAPGAAGTAETPPPVVAQQAPARDPIEQTPTPARSNPPSATAPARQPATEVAPAPASSPPATKPAAAAPRTEVLLGDLPTAARGRFPGIAFSSHVYAEDADLRAIVANGQRLTEGDRIRGLEILKITESGVVLAFEHYAVEVPIVGDWDAAM